METTRASKLGRNTHIGTVIRLGRVEGIEPTNTEQKVGQ